MDTSTRGRWWAFPRVHALSLLAALLLALPTVWMGFMTDDYGHLLVLEGLAAVGTPWDLFRFASGERESLWPMVVRGPYPWWTLPELRLAFWRPLSSALAVLDHRLFGRAAEGWHLHSVAWYVALVGAWGLLLRRVLPGAVGALALVLFTLDDAHFMTTSWLANRNALVAATPALLGVALHLEWRERGRAWALPLSLAALALGLAGGETALGLFGFVLAYEALGARGGVAERLKGLAPAALLGLGYLLLYKAQGYGASGSGSYVDPVGEPGRFVLTAAGRIPALLSGLVLGLPADVWIVGPEVGLALAGLGLLGLVMLGRLLRAAWPGLSPDERRHCRWLMGGGALALLPVAAVFPSNRVLLVPSLGGAVAVAVVLVHAWRARRRGEHSRTLAAGAGVLALMHLVLAPLLWPAQLLGMRLMNQGFEQALDVTQRELDGLRRPGQRVVLVSVPNPPLGMYAPMVLAARGMPMPRAWWTLSLSPRAHVLRRTGPAALELTLTEGQFLTTEFEHVFRGPTHPLAAGAQVALEGMKVTVLEANAQGPTRLGFEFDTPLEDESLVLLHFRDGGLRRLTPPPEGQPVPL